MDSNRIAWLSTRVLSGGSIGIHKLGHQIDFDCWAQEENQEIDLFLSRSNALTISFNSATSGDMPEVEAVVLTLATMGLLREYRTLDLLSMIPKHSRGILSRKLPPAAEFKES
nr:hypothetical protein [Tanacetum cinerariifolium]